MSKKSKPSQENIDINKIGEPVTDYNLGEKSVDQEELHPVLIKLLEKSIKEADEGKLISHEEAMRRIKERYPFLK